jgi:catechol 2,3-dioxygenase-like lactoylglutathione lyase family enzyme
LDETPDAAPDEAPHGAPDGAPPLAGLHHAAIQVRDLPGAERFYGGLLGLPVLRRWPWPEEEGARGRTGERSLWMGLGEGGFLALEACDGPSPQPQEFRDPAPGLHLLALRIAAHDRKAWLARLAGARVAVERETRWTVFVRDPEGNRIGLSHHPEELAEEPAEKPG